MPMNLLSLSPPHFVLSFTCNEFRHPAFSSLSRACRGTDHPRSSPQRGIEMTSQICYSLFILIGTSLSWPARESAWSPPTPASIGGPGVLPSVPRPGFISLANPDGAYTVHLPDNMKIDYQGCYFSCDGKNIKTKFLITTIGKNSTPFETHLFIEISGFDREHIT